MPHARRLGDREGSDDDQRGNACARAYDATTGARPVEEGPQLGERDVDRLHFGSESGQTAGERAIELGIELGIECGIVESIETQGSGSNAPRSVARAACRWYFTAPSLRSIASATS